ncbi:MAG: triose-phosphate isomerase [Candidatus Ornithospirochaeta sp.]|nr:triose-phosphate isomerase [Candidatus Ornithospirochaeta sp.]
MQHIYVNFKRFDVPSSMGGVNRIAPIADYAETVIRGCRESLEAYRGRAEFVQFYPESQIPSAVKAAEGSVIEIGCQSVYRADVAPGGNFGAFTSNRPASAAAALGCASALIGHCEERNDKNEILALGGNKDRKVVNTILNKEVLAAQNRGLRVLYCVGEKDTELEEWDKVIAEQLEIGLRDADLSSISIAYEPVWSIGPGKTPAGKEYITKVARLIKSVLGDVPVVYGGGLKEANAEMLSSIDEIDGGLIALTRFAGEIGFYPDEYLRIVELYMNGKERR